jgi:DNA polymerase
MNYRQFREHHQGCTECELHEQRKRMVFARGKVPAPILFVGEAPGASENAIGRPFVGPAGHLLDKIISLGIDGRADYAITNLVCCFPRDNKKSGNHQPPKEAIITCSARLADFIVLCQPEVIVTVGTLADKWIAHVVAEWVNWSGEFASIIHPAAILRMDISQQNLAVRRCVATLEDVLFKLESRS